MAFVTRCSAGELEALHRELGEGNRLVAAERYIEELHGRLAARCNRPAEFSSLVVGENVMGDGDRQSRGTATDDRYCASCATCGGSLVQ